MSNVTEIYRDWGRDPETGKNDPDRAIKEMCDYAAHQINSGVGETAKFRISPDKREAVNTYMRANHPEIFYIFGD